MCKERSDSSAGVSSALNRVNMNKMWQLRSAIGELKPTQRVREKDRPKNKQEKEGDPQRSAPDCSCWKICR